MAKISNSNTKAEILNAYQDLLDKLTTEQKENATLNKQLEKKRTEVEQVKNKLQTGGANANIQALRQILNEQLDKIEEGLKKEQSTFEELQQAITTERKELEEIYQIKVEAQSLEALVITNRQAKEAFEEKKTDWEADFRQEKEEKQLAWKREQEAYTYDLSSKRRKEEDAYQMEKERKEKELTEKITTFDLQMKQREELLKEKEAEFTALQKQVAGFDDRLQKEVSQAEESLKTQLTREFDFQRQLETKDLQNKIQLLEANIESLKTTITEQQTRIQALTHKADDASQQVKEIAFKAIEQSAVSPPPIIVDRGKESRGES
ncbi:MAG: hypothetical protein AAF587_05380 [Bacteroidota bacterium]